MRTAPSSKKAGIHTKIIKSVYGMPEDDVDDDDVSVADLLVILALAMILSSIRIWHTW